MFKTRAIWLAGLILLLAVGILPAAEVGVKISGPGAVDEKTIKVGQPVSFDLYFLNAAEYRGFTLGFKFVSPDIKNVVHVADSTGLNKRGDIKGYNGWNDKSIWDLGGVYTKESDWDGQLPELIGFGGVCIKQRYAAHDWAKNLSLTMIFNEPGQITVDSAFFAPGGKWMYAGPTHIPTWTGPFTFKVVK